MMFSYFCVWRVVEGDGVMEAERAGVLGVYVLILHGALVVLLCLLVAIYGAGGFGIKW
jgi:hypothetical protein